ncbi:VWA domain-containing protein, partial [Streptomyces sp. NPDC089424]|uniref:VWA domain-containing protein n=1 Tax=Streptomyces sp. NPDC089424 TaxID=3365917 RepID=UPI00381D00ED
EVVSEPVAEEPTPVPAAQAPAAPEAATDDEPQAEAEPAPQPEAEAEVVSEPVAEEPTPVPAAQAPAAPEAATDDEPQDEAEPAPQPKAEAEVVSEPVAEEPTPVPAAQAPAAPEAAADDEPQDEAEPAPQPEAEAEVVSEPVGEEAASADAVQAPPTAAAGDAHDTPVPPTLRTAYSAAAATLTAHGLTTAAPTKIYLVLDRSASMRPYYKDGSAQALAEQTLALAAHLDPEATVHVTFFSTELDGTGELTLADHENKIDELHAAFGRMGRTSYHVAVEDVLAHHDKAAAPGTPALVIFQTDGAPDAKTPATQALTDAAKTHPHLHFAFVAFGEHDNKAFDYLRKLKTGNTSFFHAGPTPKELTDSEFYEGVLADWRP